MSSLIKTVDEKGNKKWRFGFKYHREDGPAIEYFHGGKEWWLNGKRHRVDGPAREKGDGTKEWWLYGKIHREDGPAIEYANGKKEWRIEGRWISEMDFGCLTLLKQLEKDSSKNQRDFNSDDNDKIVINFGGACHWYLHGKRHRKDGPAILYEDGSTEWYLNGKRHRVDGPALERSDGIKIWCINGEFHREGGPAIEWENGDKEFWIDGKKLSEKEFDSLNLKVLSKKFKL